MSILHSSTRGKHYLLIEKKKSLEEISTYYFLAKSWQCSVWITLLILWKSLWSQYKYLKIFIKILKHTADCFVPPHSIFQSILIQLNQMKGRYVAGFLNYLSEWEKKTLEKEQKTWQDMAGKCTLVLGRRLRPNCWCNELD